MLKTITKLIKIKEANGKIQYRIVKETVSVKKSPYVYKKHEEIETKQSIK